MPELPEVETVRRGLQPAMEGARFRKVEVRRPNLRFPLPERLAARLEGARVDALSRRANCRCSIVRWGLINVSLTDQRVSR